MEMTGTGDLGIPGGLDMTMTMAMAARSTYDITEGPDPETVRLSTSTNILDGTGSIEMLGMTQDLPFSEIAGEASSMDVEMVINAQGEIVEILIGGQALPPGLLDNLGELGGTSPLSQLDPTQLVGPVLPDGPIKVGATWSTEATDSLLGITTTTESTIAGTQVVAGRDTYRIETVSTTEAFEFTFADLMDLIAANADTFAELSGEDMSAAEMQAAFSMIETMGMNMIYRMDRSVILMTTWFDAADGVVVRVEMNGPQHVYLEMSGIPDAGDITLDMDMTMTATMQLTE